MGGIVKSTTLLAQGLLDLGQDVTVFATNANPLGKSLEVPLAKEVKRKGVKVWYFPVKFFKKRFFYSPLLGKACKKMMREFDLLHLAAFWSYPGIVGAASAQKAKVPYLVSPRGTLESYSLNKNKLLKSLYWHFFEKKNVERAAAIHYTSLLEGELTQAHHHFKTSSFVVPNPVAIDEFSSPPSKLEAKSHFGLPFQAKVISFLGRIHQRKALDILIGAFAKMSDFVDCYLLLAGPDDGNMARLKKLAKDRKIEDRVKFLGFIGPEEKTFLFGASDLFWLASFFGENFGHAAVEAMAAGVPVVLSWQVGIVRETIADGAGIVVSLHEDEVCFQLKELLKNERKRKEMSKKAMESAKRYEKKKVCQMMLKKYQEILKKSEKA